MIPLILVYEQVPAKVVGLTLGHCQCYRFHLNFQATTQAVLNQVEFNCNYGWTKDHFLILWSK